jgi:hypothetical protein
MLTPTLGRIFGGIFAGTMATPVHQQAAQSEEHPARSAASLQDIAVGQGSPNERHVTIAGIPMLFRDEGDVVVQFRPEFDYDLRETAVGAKLIPSLTPHWAVCAEHHCGLTQAIATAIKAGGAAPSRSVAVSASREPEARSNLPRVERVDKPIQASTDEPPVASTQPRRNDRTNFGRIKEWGEKKFPDGKRPGKFYESFCLTLTTRGEDRVLQGEGLRDAISDVGCQIGEFVEVKRLGKIKVPAVDKHGVPKLDDLGQPMMWDKWQWSIKRKS